MVKIHRNTDCKHFILAEKGVKVPIFSDNVVLAVLLNGSGKVNMEAYKSLI